MPIAREEETSLVVEDELFRFIDEHRYLPPEVWNLIEAKYHWTDKEAELCDRHDCFTVYDMLEIIGYPHKPNYKYISNIDEKYLEEYLSLREKAIDNYFDEEYTYAFNLINKAFKIYSKDPELLEIYGYILMENNVLEFAGVCLKEAFYLDRTKLVCALKIGIILNLMGKYNEAIPYLESYLNEAHDKDIKDQVYALYNLGYAFYYNENYDMAKNYFYQVLGLGEIDKEMGKLTRNYLQNIDSKLQGKTISKIKPNRIKIKKTVDSKKIVSKKQKKIKATIRKNRWKSIISVLVFMCIFYSYKIYSKNFANKKTTIQMDKEMKNEIDNIMKDPNTKEVEYPDEKAEKTVGTIEDFQDNTDYPTYSFYLNNIIPCDLYGIREDDGSLRMCNQEAITANNLSKQIVARFYVGNINGLNIMFIDNNFTEKLLDKDGGYKVSGIRCSVVMDDPVKIPITNGEEITISKYFITNIWE